MNRIKYPVTGWRDPAAIPSTHPDAAQPEPFDLLPLVFDAITRCHGQYTGVFDEAAFDVAVVRRFDVRPQGAAWCRDVLGKLGYVRPVGFLGRWKVVEDGKGGGG